jgi:type III restriction enzyme
MNKGAHFYKCDFQIHSPRDIAWTGNKFGVEDSDVASLTDEEKESIEQNREQFAREYLEKVRAKGLNVIAITDHHDVEFVKVIRKQAELQNKTYLETEEFNKIIIVFPGIELTLSNPAAQAIILFDANFSDSNLDSVINLLGITPTNRYHKNTTATQRISEELIHNLSHLHKKLDEVAYCKGNYIVLPNVTRGGGHSILRNGFHEHYRKMPSVGGYVDKAISDETGYQNKLNGGDVNYGNKSIGVISTSDNRFEDGRELGNYFTYIKWAEPTAEAIRQACLAKQSRISQDEPELPQIFIDSIDVTNSKFLGSFNINFNQQYNALIGGRGTGKSTVLEYLRWCLSDQTNISLDSEEITSIDKRRKALIKNTLEELGGEVRVTMVKNGIPHIVKKNSTSNESQLKIGDNPFEVVSEDDVRRIIPVQSYSQRQLSNVGIRTEELKRFIDKPIQDELNSIGYRVNENKSKLKDAYSNYIRKKEITLEKENILLESKSLKSQVDSIRKSLQGISEDQQKIIAKKSGYDKEAAIVSKSTGELEIFEGKADELLDLLKQYPEPLGDIEELENKNLIRDIHSKISSKFGKLENLVKQMKEIFSGDSLKELNEQIENWKQIKEKFEGEYQTAKESSKASETQLKEIQKLENRIVEINDILAERDSLLKEIGEPEEEFRSLMQEWTELHQEKIELLNKQAKIFSDLSKGLIKAEVAKHLDLQKFKRRLKAILEGSRIREERLDKLEDHILASENTIQKFNLILEELRLLAEFKLSEDKSIELPRTPELIASGFSKEHLEKVCSYLDADNWIQLSSDELDFIPEFKYTTNIQLDETIEFAQASAGQQATALLTVLLNQPGIPLLIDQPEDDIDNRAINKVIENIWLAKRKRQLVFTSHNANLVVNGDAELVICCDYKDTSSQTRGIIKHEGAIDNIDIRKEITSVMEGGEKAFKLRKAKYGF